MEILLWIAWPCGCGTLFWSKNRGSVQSENYGHTQLFYGPFCDAKNFYANGDATNISIADAMDYS